MKLTYAGWIVMALATSFSAQSEDKPMKGFRVVSEATVPKELVVGYKHVLAKIRQKATLIYVGWQPREGSTKISAGRRVISAQFVGEKPGQSFSVLIGLRNKLAAPQYGLNAALRDNVVPRSLKLEGEIAFGRWKGYDIGVIGKPGAIKLLGSMATGMRG